MNMSDTNYTSFNYQNIKSEFISGLFVSNEDQHAREILVTGSNQRIPLEWESILGSWKFENTQQMLIFQKPVNYFHLKVEIIGAGSTDATKGFSFIVHQPKEENETRAFLKNKTITFLGCARSCIDAIPHTLDIIQKIGTLFKEYSVAVFENDSNDGTKELLFDLERKGELKLIQNDNLDQALPLRTQRISFGRNRLHSFVQDNPTDYFCVIDMDGILAAGIDLRDGFISCFSYEPCWDAVFPINTGIYYDIWALRHSELCPTDYERQMNLACPTIGNTNILDRYLHSLQNLDFSQMSGWLKVDSAFGGIGIYKTSAFKYSDYYGFRDGYQMCEHVSFHQKAALNGASLYINPKFIAGKVRDLA